MEFFSPEKLSLDNPVQACGCWLGNVDRKCGATFSFSSATATPHPPSKYWLHNLRLNNDIPAQVFTYAEVLCQ